MEEEKENARNALRQEPSPRADGDGESSIPFDQVQETCATFTGQWQAASRPDLLAFLGRVTQDDQPTLLRNLLEFEVRKRRQIGEFPRAEDYLDRLPEHTAIVRQVFLETSSLSLTGDLVEVTHEVRPDHLPATRLGDFRLLSQIGRGGMGAVYEAVHVTRGSHVALKTLPAVTPEALHRFKREFRSVAGMSHPNLVGLHTLENDGGQFFITMDLVDGVDFRSWVRPNNQLDQDRIRSTLPQLIGAVMALHAQGVVHRDLKPQNVLVTRDGRVVVLDFGLVAELSNATGTMSRVAGTPSYMAPEQAAGTSVGPPSDWYSVGVMIYEALAGMLPFRSTDVWEMVRLKQERDAPPLPENNGHHQDLSELCMQLLARAPADRPDPLEIAGVVQSQIEPTTQRPSQTHGLIGREMHLAALAEAYEDVNRRDEPTLVFISGRSGEGKTSLAETFLEPIRARSSVVLSGRCYDRESVPFKALDTLVDALTTHLRSLPGERAAQLLPDDITILAELFPELNRCEVVATAPKQRIDAIDQQQVRARAFGALRLLLDRVSQSRPLIAFVDDLQWGDQDSARALFEVLRPSAAPRVMFIGSFRSDEADDSPFLNEWLELQRSNDVALDKRDVTVGPLNVEQSTQFMINELGADTETIRRRAVQFHAQTGGNPFLMTELVGCFDPDSDSFQATDLHTLMRQKLASLPAEARTLLDAVSVSGQALAIEEAMATANLSTSHDDMLIAMRNARLLRVVADKLDTYHDRIRYAVIDEMELPAKRAIHAQLAGVIEQRAGRLTDSEVETIHEKGQLKDPKQLARVYDLAFHWDAAADPRRALAYSLSAAEQAKRQFALEAANEQYALAARNSADTAKAVRFRIARGRAETLMITCQFELAAAELEHALDLAEQELDIADVIGLQGEVARGLGRIAEGLEYLEDAIGRIGVKVPRSRFGLAWGITKEIGIQVKHTLMPNRLHRRPSDPSEDLCNWLLGRVEYCYYVHNVPYLLWASMVGLNRAERIHKSSSLSMQYIVHANDMAVMGWHKRADRYYQAAIDLSRELNDQRVSAIATSHHSIGCLAAAKYERGVEKAEAALGLLTKVGDRFEWEGALLWLALNQYGLGNLGAAVSASRESLQSCVRNDHQYTAMLALSYLLRSSLGQAPFDELVGSVSVLRGHRVGKSTTALAEGYWHRHHSRTGEALEAMENAWQVCVKHRSMTSFNMWALSELVTALRQHVESLERREKDASSLRRRWRKMSRWAIRLSWFLPPERPHALRELSLLHAHRGKTNKALRIAEKSRSIAEQQKASYEHAKSSLVVAQLRLKLNHPDAQNEVAAAQTMVDQIESEAKIALEA